LQTHVISQFPTAEFEVYILIAMDTDKVKVFGARVKVDGTGKLAELERAEKVLGIYRYQGHVLISKRKKCVLR